MTLKNNILNPGDLAVVVGSGASGLGASRLLHLLGARVRVLDKADAYSDEFRSEGAKYGWELLGGAHSPEQLRGAAVVVASPGVPMKVLEPLLAAAGNPLFMAELELASRFAPESTIAVTGTSGKTTTVSLIAAMLEEAGKKVFLGGNIGTPLSEYVVQREKGAEAADVLVLETSSFQLQGCSGFHPHVAMLLNLSENHLDQHRDMDEYREAKFSLFRNQMAGDLAFVGQDLLEQAAGRGLQGRIVSLAVHGNLKDSALLGAQNRTKMEAA